MYDVVDFEVCVSYFGTNICSLMNHRCVAFRSSAGSLFHLFLPGILSEPGFIGLLG
jgi:hypothetical protein